MVATSERYRPVVRLGVGGMAEIWLGVLEGARRIRKPVVLKKPLGGYQGAQDEDSLAAEAALTSQLSHPNIVHAYELVETHDGLMLAMEYLYGLSLRQIQDHFALERARLDWPVALRIAIDAAQGLHHAHRLVGDDGRSLGIIHRDVSPDNLMVTEQGATKVLDFGIATLGGEQSEHLRVKGTLGYLSPEQVRGDSLDCRTDIFSLGVVLHEMLTGRRLFDRETPSAAARAPIEGEIPSLDPSLPAAVRATVQRMLTRTASERERSLAAVIADLEASLPLGRGATRDVAAMLRAELGPRLDRRRRALRRLLSRPDIPAPLGEDCRERSIATLIDHALDRG